MAVANYTAEFIRKRQINDAVWYYKLKLISPETLDFQAGQLASFKIGKLRRQYSIASSPLFKNEIDFFVDVRPGGIGSQYFLEAEVGDIAEFMSPLGRFTYQPPAGDSDPVILLCTGTGIAPFISMLEQQLEVGQDVRKFHLFWGLRHVKDIYLQEELDALEEKHANFDYKVCLSQPEVEWDGLSGYCTKNLLENWSNIINIGNARFYLCGAGNMISDGLKLLTDRGIAGEQILHEKFF